MITERAYLPLTSASSENVDGFVRGRVSIIMPCYNESNLIAKSIAEANYRFREVCSDFEIIVVDDGSIDDSKVVIQNLADSSVKLLGYKKNQGKGHAIKLGLHSATGQFAFMVDSDSEVYPKELRTYLEALQTADIVIGSKRHKLSNVRTPAMRRFLSLGFNIIERLLTGVRSTDTQAGVKCAKSSVLYRILPLLSVKKYAFDAELLTVASLLDYKIVELPVDIDLRATFKVREVFRMFIDLLGITYRLRIRRWYQKNYVLMTDTYKPIIPW